MNNNSLKIQIVKASSKLFPSGLRRLNDCPNKIYIRGNIKSKQTKIAIVGTRKASSDGIKNANYFAYVL